LKASTSLLKRVTGRIFRKVSDFKKASRNFIFSVLHKKGAKCCENYRTLKKYSSRGSIPLRKLGKDGSYKDRSQ
jgi:hypothetical protein